MFERILVAIDFSDPSVEALRWAARRFPEARLILFHSLEPSSPPEYVRRVLETEIEVDEEMELDARTNLELLADGLDANTEISLARGWPPRQVAALARAKEVDLVVVGAHRRRIWPWDEPGATAEAMAERAPSPVLIWRHTPERSEPTVLACLDLRAGGDGVARAAARLARFVGGRLVLLHVMGGTLQAYLRAVSSPTKVEESMRTIQASARAELSDRIPEEFREGLNRQSLVVRGRPITQILATAESEVADLIVIGKSRPEKSAERRLMGSVTGKVVRGASCSVLIVSPAG